MSVAGSPDFITQQGVTNSFLGEFTGASLVVNIFDLTAVVDPSQQALMFQVIGVPGSPVTRLSLILSYNTAIQVTNQQTIASKNIPAVLPLDSQIIVQGEAATLQVAVQGVPGDATGAYKLHVWAVTQNPTTWPVRKYDVSGHGNSASVAVGAGANTAVKPNSPAGYYGRVRTLSWATQAGPAAVSSCGFFDSGSASDIWTFIIFAGAFSSDKLAVDYSTTAQIVFRNSTSVGVIATIAWEDVPI